MLMEDDTDEDEDEDDDDEDENGDEDEDDEEEEDDEDEDDDEEEVVTIVMIVIKFRTRFIACALSRCKKKRLAPEIEKCTSILYTPNSMVFHKERLSPIVFRIHVKFLFWG